MTEGETIMKQMLLIDARTLDPDHNLALEEYVFSHMPRDKEYLILWQNDNAVIIGRHQNTLAEIDAQYVKQHNIRVVRRMSGGGAVYHDLGNLNFSFIVDAAGSQVDLERFCLRIALALGELGLDARLDGRNDILAEGCKISGNAQYMREGRVMHHGTLLFDSDLSVLSKALKPDPEKIKAKGVKSVRSRVANIRSLLKQDMTLDQFRDHLARYLLGGDGMRYELTQQDLAKIEAIRAQRYGTWEWNYGASAQCDLERRTRIEGVGTVRAHIRLDHGRIADVTFTGDFFSTIEPAGLSALLRGRPLTQEALQDVDPAPYISGMTGEALRHLLLEG
jgi:lipoate-protein ligase A